MWMEMQRRNDALHRAMREHERLCRSAHPELPAIACARWRIAEASRHRLEYLIDTALPMAERQAGSEAARQIAALRTRTLEYRQRISAAVADWPTEAIAADWDGYCAATARLRRAIATRLTDEAAVMRLVALSHPQVLEEPVLPRRCA